MADTSFQSQEDLSFSSRQNISLLQSHHQHDASMLRARDLEQQFKLREEEVRIREESLKARENHLMAVEAQIRHREEEMSHSIPPTHQLLRVSELEQALQIVWN